MTGAVFGRGFTVTFTEPASCRSRPRPGPAGRRASSAARSGTVGHDAHALAVAADVALEQPRKARCSRSRCAPDAGGRGTVEPSRNTENASGRKRCAARPSTNVRRTRWASKAVWPSRCRASSTASCWATAQVAQDRVDEARRARAERRQALSILAPARWPRLRVGLGDGHHVGRDAPKRSCRRAGPSAVRALAAQHGDRVVEVQSERGPALASVSATTTRSPARDAGAERDQPLEAERLQVQASSASRSCAAARPRST